mgnify:FL=1
MFDNEFLLSLFNLNIKYLYDNVITEYHIYYDTLFEYIILNNLD